MCLMKKSFYVFDCLSRDEKGMPVSDGTAIVTKHSASTDVEIFLTSFKIRERNASILDTYAKDDVEYTPPKPKKPKQHKYWVQPGVKTPQNYRNLLNEVTASTPVIHSGCNESETLRITDTASTLIPPSIDE
ncbi:hypothetical protein PoB_004949800 [Plakobranchus ocellatus]|uniref:Uncharacterized protein n=1 Tax=Plakobranchus ocellatus TaxID=259542 RepID=A0AAV4BW10_9GAST|nr:hypothetical protein PoB_004949800 [Plakobranchus ocellatus]